METTNLSRIEQAVAFVNEVRSINKRFEGTSVSITAKCEFNEKGEILISSYIWAASQIIRSTFIYNLEWEEVCKVFTCEGGGIGYWKEHAIFSKINLELWRIWTIFVA